MAVNYIRHLWPNHLGDEHIRKYDLIIADPPFNQSVQYEDDVSCDAMTDMQYIEWTRNTIATLQRYMTIDGLLVWVTPPRYGWLTWDALQNNNCWLYNDCPVIMHEPFSQYQKSRMTIDYRLVFMAYLRCGNCTLTLPREMSKRQEMGDKRADPEGRVPGMVWNIRRLQGTSKDREKWHPCQLAPEFYQRLVSLKRGDVDENVKVLDAFAGVGRAADFALNCTLVDQSPTYLRKARSRREEADGQRSENAGVGSGAISES